MKTLYLDCGMGAAGDMLTAALLELLPEAEQEAFLNQMNSLGLPGVQLSRETVSRCGINGTHVTVLVHGQEEEAEDVHSHEDIRQDGHGHHHSHGDTHHDGHEHHHHHSSLADIRHIVEEHLPVSEKVRQDILAVYGLIAEAESKAHGVPVTDIHFHEVGTLDAVADVTAVCLLMERLGPEEVLVSPVHVGSGQVRCAHGILPVPAPATAYILRGVPTYGGAVKGELCTPTGAALLKHFATGFWEMPSMRVESIGYGMGKKEFEAANCVRAFLGQREMRPVQAGPEAEGDSADGTETVLELSCNLDDMTAEALGFAMEQLLAAGALDVWTSPIGMKKNRPGVMLSLLCRVSERDTFLHLLFLHTTTLGVREQRRQRWTLHRREETVETAYGPLRKKCVSGYGVSREKYEYDDLARIARERGLSLSDARKLAVASAKAATQQQPDR